MASHKEKDDEPMLLHSNSSSRTRPFTPRSRSVSLANTSFTIHGLDSSSHYNRQAAQNPTSRDTVDSMFRNGLYDYAKRWAERFATSVNRYLLGIMNPHKKYGQSWSIFFAVSCLFAIFVDPLFFFLIKVYKDEKCLLIDWPMAHLFVAIRTLTDVLFCVNIVLQFRMAYVAPGSTVFGAGQLVKRPIKIALHYFRGKLLLDLFIVLPFPQILVLWILPAQLGAENNAKNLLRTAVLIQYIPKLCRLLPFLAGQTLTGFIFESACVNFIINLSTFMLASHFIGSCWYLMGLQRVNQCLRDACGSNSNHTCRKLIDCGRARRSLELEMLLVWENNVNANACFQENGFHYGIYSKAVNLTYDPSLFTRYIYSLFWGFQQISTLAGNQVPSYYRWEVLFTMGIVGLGLLLFAFLIGNMQNFLQGLGRRNLETLLRQRDVEQWMSHRRLPEDIRKRVQEAERFNWAATRGVNEEMLFQNMPDDIQRDIRRHLFKFIDKVSIFSGMDELVLDAIRVRLKQKIYIKNSTILYIGGLLDQMVLIVRGDMLSIEENGSVIHLSEGDVCGGELLTWCIERSSVNSDDTMTSLPSKEMISNKIVTCVTNVEAFSLSVADLKDVTNLFSRFLRNHRVQREDSSGLEIPNESVS